MKANSAVNEGSFGKSNLTLKLLRELIELGTKEEQIRKVLPRGSRRSDLLHEVQARSFLAQKLLEEVNHPPKEGTQSSTKLF